MSHSDDDRDQGRAAQCLLEVSQQHRGGLPAECAAPTVHALSKLINVENRVTVTSAAKALKVRPPRRVSALAPPLFFFLFILFSRSTAADALRPPPLSGQKLLENDAFRGAAVSCGVVPSILVALERWDEDASCLRELFGSVQSLCWDGECVLAVLGPGASEGAVEEGSGFFCLELLLDLLESRDETLKRIALACLANALSAVDTKLLRLPRLVDLFVPHCRRLLDLCAHEDSSVALFATAAVANATAHPILCGALRDCGAAAALSHVLEKSAGRVTVGGVSVEACVGEALGRLGAAGRGAGDAQRAGNRPRRRFRFAHGQAPAVELSLSTAVCNATVQAATCLWLLVLVVLLRSSFAAHEA